MGLTANELTWETGSEGSNPSLSAGRGAPRRKQESKEEEARRSKQQAEPSPGAGPGVFTGDRQQATNGLRSQVDRLALAATAGSVGRTDPPAFSTVTA